MTFWDGILRAGSFSGATTPVDRVAVGPESFSDARPVRQPPSLATAGCLSLVGTTSGQNHAAESPPDLRIEGPSGRLWVLGIGGSVRQPLPLSGANPARRYSPKVCAAIVQLDVLTFYG
jgi:hypothetical protein